MIEPQIFNFLVMCMFYKDVRPGVEAMTAHNFRETKIEQKLNHYNDQYVPKGIQTVAGEIIFIGDVVVNNRLSLKWTF